MIEIKTGDKNTLTGPEITALEQRVLPAARRWLRTQPDLAHHAVKTLMYWGEPLVDDHFRDYTPPKSNRMENEA